MRRTALLILGVLALLAAAACSGKSDASPSTSTAAPSSAAGNEAESTTSSPQTVTVPLTTHVASDGTLGATVNISVGGGPSVPVLLDTGSTGVWITQSSLGPEATSLGQPADADFVGGDMTGVLESATVTIGGVTTPSPITVQVAQTGTCDGKPCDPASFFGTGVQGILGIGLSDGPTAGGTPFTPLLQMAAPYNAGFTINASASGAGTLVIGPVSAPAGSISLPLLPATSGSWPNGAPAFQKDLQLCWTIGTASACGPTDLDLGMSVTQITPSDIPGVPITSGIVTSGTPVTIAASQGGPSVWQFTAGSSPSVDMVNTTSDLGSATEFNTGLAFFVDNVVAFDVTGSQVFVTAK